QAVSFFDTCREHDDEYVGTLPERPANIQAIHIGEHQVEDDNIRLFTSGNLQACFAVKRRQDLEVRLAEKLFQPVNDLDLIFDNKDTYLALHRTLPPKRLTLLLTGKRRVTVVVRC